MPASGTTVGFLHTAPGHVTTFDALARRSGAGAVVDVVVPHLLDRARAATPDDDLGPAVADAVRGLVDRGADVVVCTCSTLGPLAERVDRVGAGVPVLRVDRPMAREAVRRGSRIGVVAALQSTLGPTGDLLEEEAARAGASVTLVESCVAEAWSAFEAGDQDGYLAQVSAAARALAGEVDVVVLAQASMAGAITDLDDLPIPVLASPQAAVRAALAAAP
ncbi:aspartate/glutamate racemase family protein [Nocardioides sp. GXZ039]|uniref:aspartate/glutamate racemase family protein n=1 Tax=Nocardioides sp. GXZ039 TaxID=3136018 RepID=UPI0030F44097